MLCHEPWCVCCVDRWHPVARRYGNLQQCDLGNCSRRAQCVWIVWQMLRMLWFFRERSTPATPLQVSAILDACDKLHKDKADPFPFSFSARWCTICTSPMSRICDRSCRNLLHLAEAGQRCSLLGHFLETFWDIRKTWFVSQIAAKKRSIHEDPM